MDNYLRRCLMTPIDDIYTAADLLKKAIEAHNEANFNLAKDLIIQSNFLSIGDWYQSITGKFDSNIHRYQPKDNNKTKLKKVNLRMPSAKMKKILIERDGYQCRYCGIPVIRSEIRNKIKKAYPEALSWGKRNSERHNAFLSLWLTYEHVLPHSLGGDNSIDNMIISCQACNCGKSNYSLEELSLNDPRNFIIKESNWNGLENFKH